MYFLPLVDYIYDLQIRQIFWDQCTDDLITLLLIKVHMRADNKSVYTSVLMSVYSCVELNCLILMFI